MAGLTLAGFETKRLQEILTEIKDELRASDQFGPAANLSARSPIGQFIGMFADREADLWALAQVMYNALDAEAAEGTLLDNLCELVGITRNDATSITFDVTCSGVNGTVIPAGSIVRIPQGERYITAEDATIAAGTATVEVSAENTGFQDVGANTVTSIVTAVTGWNSVTGPAADTTGGSGVETDLELRRRRRNSLQAAGTATDGAIRAEILDVDEVEQAVVVSNRTLATVNSIPAKSFHSIVHPAGLATAVKEEIAEAIYRTMPAGIQSYGSENFTVTDQNGYSQPVAFSFSTGVTVNVVTTVTVDPTLLPADAQEQIEDAITTVFEGPENTETGERSGGLEIGEDVRFAEVYAAIFNAFDGILTIALTLNGGTADIPIDIDTGEIGTLGTLTVNVS